MDETLFPEDEVGFQAKEWVLSCATFFFWNFNFFHVAFVVFNFLRILLLFVSAPRGGAGSFITVDINQIVICMVQICLSGILIIVWWIVTGKNVGLLSTLAVLIPALFVWFFFAQNLVDIFHSFCVCCRGRSASVQRRERG